MFGIKKGSPPVKLILKILFVLLRVFIKAEISILGNFPIFFLNKMRVFIKTGTAILDIFFVFSLENLLKLRQ
jgi:hypothetical protein